MLPAESSGWSGYRARTIRGDRVVYFTSTGLLPRCQGLRLIPTLQHLVVGQEARSHPLRPVTTVVRTRNPHSYQLALRTFGTEPVLPDPDGNVRPDRRELVARIGSWLGFGEFDPATAVVRDAYDVDGGLYGREPRSGDPAIDALFARLEPSDALLVLGRRNRRSALQLAVRGPNFGDGRKIDA